MQLSMEQSTADLYATQPLSTATADCKAKPSTFGHPGYDQILHEMQTTARRGATQGWTVTNKGLT